MRWAILIVALLYVSCSPLLDSNNQQNTTNQSDYFQKLADKGILISTFSNDTLRNLEASTLPISSVFEIGGLTHILVAEQIIEMANQGQIDLESAIYHLLPTDLQSDHLKNVTIQDCLSHLSGFPRLPNNIGAKQIDQQQPFENYTIDDLKSFLDSWQPKTAKDYQYTQIGYALLGLAFDEISIPRDEPIIQGHNRIGTAVPPLQSGIFKCAVGGMLSFESLQNLLVEWCQNPSDAMQQSMKSIAPSRIDRQTSIGSGWHIYQVNKSYSVVLQKGSTAGHSTFIAICPQSKSGVLIAAPKKVELGELGFNILSDINNNWKRGNP